MDRLKLIEVIAEELRLIAPWMDDGEFGKWAGRIADRIILAGPLGSTERRRRIENDPDIDLGPGIGPTPGQGRS